jgi:6-phosphogluconate dehydrogenase (decarboxylating)
VDRPPETVGFIGLGQMGSGMAKKLLSAEVDLIVYDQHQKITNEYAQLGDVFTNLPPLWLLKPKNISLPSVRS